MLFSDKPVEITESYQMDSVKVKDFEANYMFNKFHHLFEYDATYYSYLLAKVASHKLYSK